MLHKQMSTELETCIQNWPVDVVQIDKHTDERLRLQRPTLPSAKKRLGRQNQIF